MYLPFVFDVFTNHSSFFMSAFELVTIFSSNALEVLSTKASWSEFVFAMMMKF